MSDDWPSTEASLLLEIRDPRNVLSWEAFNAIYAPLLCRFAERRGFQPSDASDVAQEVLLRVHQSIRDFQYDPQRGSFRGWLGLLTRQVMSAVAKRNARPGQGSGGSDVMPLADLEGTHEADWVEVFNYHVFTSALARIRTEYGHDEWSAFELVWTQDLAPAEVAQRLNHERTWVYKCVHKIKLRLKREILFLTADEAVFLGP